MLREKEAAMKSLGALITEIESGFQIKKQIRAMLSGLEANYIRLKEASNNKSMKKKGKYRIVQEKRNEDWDKSELEAMALTGCKKRQAPLVRG